MSEGSSPWKSRARGYVALPRVRRAILVAVGVTLLITGYLVYWAFQDDPRFYNRVELYVPHEISSLGMGDVQLPKHEDRVISPNIWQVYLVPPEFELAALGIPKKQQGFIDGWKEKNPKYNYHLFKDEDAKEFVKENFPGNAELQRIFSGPGSTAMKSDLLRYLVLFAKGGVYTDLDTIIVKPIDDWVPEKYRDKARLVIGVEFDRLGGEQWKGVHRDFQFAQWTIAAAPGHPVFSAMVARAIFLIKELEKSRWKDFSKIKPSTNDVLTTTGPAAWTDAVFQELREIDPTLKTLEDLSGLKEERLIGDVLILPINGFGTGQRHSGSIRGSTPNDARIKHKFHGIWKGHTEKVT